MSKMRLWCCALLGLPAVATADTAHAPDERSYITESALVLTAGRLAQPLPDAPGAVTVIDREMIRVSGFREIADLMRLVPGFSVASTNPGQAALAYHGFGDEYNTGIQVLVDGRSTGSPARFGGTPFNTLGIAIDDIERIEVFRGANSAAFGADAARAVINIVSRAPRDSQGLAVAVTAGNGGIWDQTLRYGAVAGDLAYRITAMRRRDNGFDDVSDDRRVSALDLQADWTVGARSLLTVSLGSTRDGSGTGAYTAPIPRAFR